MWIKDIKNYNIEVYRDDEKVYSGNVDEAPEDLKQLEIKNIKIEHKTLKINIT